MPLIWNSQTTLDARYVKYNPAEALAKLLQLSILVKVTSAITLTSGVASTLAFGANVYETLPSGYTSQHSVAVDTEKVFCRETGKYLLVGNAEFASHATGERILQITVETVVVAATRTAPSPANVTDLSCSAIASLTAGEVVRMVAYQDSGGNLNLNSTTRSSPTLAMHYLGQ